MNVAIIGYGIVGGGVDELLKDGRLGIRVKRVLDIRPLPELGDRRTDNIADILGDPEIDCIVEAIGGLHPALSFVTSALRAGKHVVTSNKELMSRAMASLAEIAAVQGVQIRFSASVGGGIPWIENLVRQKRSDHLLAVDGIVNGTTNYILDAMGKGADFAVALKEAQRLGYAEANPSADLDGLDVQRKCAISASVGFDTVIEPEDIPTLGIANIRKEDIDTFAAQGLVCKLMMFAARGDGAIAAYVEPALLTKDVLAAHTPTNHNCITMYGDYAGQLSFYGQGAGRYPTANNIVQDILDLASGIAFMARGVKPLPVDNQPIMHRYYVRTAKPELVSLFAEPFGPGVLTAPVDVQAFHAMAAEILAADPEAFFAGVQ